MTALPTQHYLDVVCPNCSRLVSVPVRIGQVHINPKSLYLVNLSASVKHSCRPAISDLVADISDVTDASSEDGADHIEAGEHP